MSSSLRKNDTASAATADAASTPAKTSRGKGSASSSSSSSTIHHTAGSSAKTSPKRVSKVPRGRRGRLTKLRKQRGGMGSSLSSSMMTSSMTSRIVNRVGSSSMSSSQSTTSASATSIGINASSLLGSAVNSATEDSTLGVRKRTTLRRSVRTSDPSPALGVVRSVSASTTATTATEEAESITSVAEGSASSSETTASKDGGDADSSSVIGLGRRTNAASSLGLGLKRKTLAQQRMARDDVAKKKKRRMKKKKQGLNRSSLMSRISNRNVSSSSSAAVGVSADKSSGINPRVSTTLLDSGESGDLASEFSSSEWDSDEDDERSFYLSDVTDEVSSSDARWLSRNFDGLSSDEASELASYVPGTHSFRRRVVGASAAGADGAGVALEHSDSDSATTVGRSAKNAVGPSGGPSGSAASKSKSKLRKRRRKRYILRDFGERIMELKPLPSHSIGLSKYNEEHTLHVNSSHLKGLSVDNIVQITPVFESTVSKRRDDKELMKSSDRGGASASGASDEDGRLDSDWDSAKLVGGSAESKRNDGDSSEQIKGIKNGRLDGGRRSREGGRGSSSSLWNGKNSLKSRSSKSKRGRRKESRWKQAEKMAMTATRSDEIMILKVSKVGKFPKQSWDIRVNEFMSSNHWLFNKNIRESGGVRRRGVVGSEKSRSELGGMGSSVVKLGKKSRTRSSKAVSSSSASSGGRLVSVKIEKVNPKMLELELVEVSVKNQYISRGDTWLFLERMLRNRVVHVKQVIDGRNSNSNQSKQSLLKSSRGIGKQRKSGSMNSLMSISNPSIMENGSNSLPFSSSASAPSTLHSSIHKDDDAVAVAVAGDDGGGVIVDSMVSKGQFGFCPLVSAVIEECKLDAHCTDDPIEMCRMNSNKNTGEADNHQTTTVVSGLKRMNNVSCGFITDRTKFLIRSKSASIVYCVQMSQEMWDFTDRGERYFEVFVNGFVRTLLEKWKEQQTSHMYSIVFFTRTYYTLSPSHRGSSGPRSSAGNPAANPPSSSVPPAAPTATSTPTPAAASSSNSAPISSKDARDIYETDENGNLYRDYYKEVIRHSQCTDYRTLAAKLRKEFYSFPRCCKWRKAAANPAGSTTTAASAAAGGGSAPSSHSMSVSASSLTAASTSASSLTSLGGFTPVHSGQPLRRKQSQTAFQSAPLLGHHKSDTTLTPGLSASTPSASVSSSSIPQTSANTGTVGSSVPTKVMPSRAAHGNVLEMIQLCCNQFDKHFLDRDLQRTGMSIVIITAGTGTWFVKQGWGDFTKCRILSNGINCEIVSLTHPPFHPTPMFIYSAPRNTAAQMKKRVNNPLNNLSNSTISTIPGGLSTPGFRTPKQSGSLLWDSTTMSGGEDAFSSTGSLATLGLSDHSGPVTSNSDFIMDPPTKVSITTTTTTTTTTNTTNNNNNGNEKGKSTQQVIVFSGQTRYYQPSEWMQIKYFDYDRFHEERDRESMRIVAELSTKTATFMNLLHTFRRFVPLPQSHTIEHPFLEVRAKALGSHHGYSSSSVSTGVGTSSEQKAGPVKSLGIMPNVRRLIVGNGPLEKRMSAPQQSTSADNRKTHAMGLLESGRFGSSAAASSFGSLMFGSSKTAHSSSVTAAAASAALAPTAATSAAISAPLSQSVGTARKIGFYPSSLSPTQERRTEDEVTKLFKFHPDDFHLNELLDRLSDDTLTEFDDSLSLASAAKQSLVSRTANGNGVNAMMNSTTANGYVGSSVSVHPVGSSAESGSSQSSTILSSPIHNGSNILSVTQISPMQLHHPSERSTVSSLPGLVSSSSTNASIPNGMILQTSLKLERSLSVDSRLASDGSSTTTRTTTTTATATPMTITVQSRGASAEGSFRVMDGISSNSLPNSPNFSAAVLPMFAPNFQEEGQSLEDDTFSLRLAVDEGGAAAAAAVATQFASGMARSLSAGEMPDQLPFPMQNTEVDILSDEDVAPPLPVIPSSMVCHQTMNDATLSSGILDMMNEELTPMSSARTPQHDWAGGLTTDEDLNTPPAPSFVRDHQIQPNHLLDSELNHRDVSPTVRARLGRRTFFVDRPTLDIVEDKNRQSVNFQDLMESDHEMMPEDDDDGGREEEAVRVKEIGQDQTVFLSDQSASLFNPDPTFDSLSMPSHYPETSASISTSSVAPTLGMDIPDEDETPPLPAEKKGMIKDCHLDIVEESTVIVDDGNETDGGNDDNPSLKHAADSKLKSSGASVTPPPASSSISPASAFYNVARMSQSASDLDMSDHNRAYLGWVQPSSVSGTAMRARVSTTVGRIKPDGPDDSDFDDYEDPIEPRIVPGRMGHNSSIFPLTDHSVIMRDYVDDETRIFSDSDQGSTTIHGINITQDHPVLAVAAAAAAASVDDVVSLPMRTDHHHHVVNGVLNASERRDATLVASQSLGSNDTSKTKKHGKQSGVAGASKPTGPSSLTSGFSGSAPLIDGSSPATVANEPLQKNRPILPLTWTLDENQLYNKNTRFAELGPPSYAYCGFLRPEQPYYNHAWKPFVCPATMPIYTPKRFDKSNYDDKSIWEVKPATFRNAKDWTMSADQLMDELVLQRLTADFQLMKVDNHVPQRFHALFSPLTIHTLQRMDKDNVQITHYKRLRTVSNRAVFMDGTITGVGYSDLTYRRDRLKKQKKQQHEIVQATVATVASVARAAAAAGIAAPMSVTGMNDTTVVVESDGSSPQLSTMNDMNASISPPRLTIESVEQIPLHHVSSLNNDDENTLVESEFQFGRRLQSLSEITHSSSRFLRPSIQHGRRRARESSKRLKLAPPELDSLESRPSSLLSSQRNNVKSETIKMEEKKDELMGGMTGMSGITHQMTEDEGKKETEETEQEKAQLQHSDDPEKADETQQMIRLPKLSILDHSTSVEETVEDARVRHTASLQSDASQTNTTVSVSEEPEPGSIAQQIDHSMEEKKKTTMMMTMREELENIEEEGGEESGEEVIARTECVSYNYFLWSDHLQKWQFIQCQLSDVHIGFHWDHLDYICSEHLKTIEQQMKSRKLSFALIPPKEMVVFGEIDASFYKAYMFRFKSWIDAVLNIYNDCDINGGASVRGGAAGVRSSSLESRFQKTGIQVLQEHHTHDDGDVINGLATGMNDVSYSNIRKIIDIPCDGRRTYLVLNLDGLFDPRQAFHISIDWLIATGAQISQWVTQMKKLSTQHSMKLIQLPSVRSDADKLGDPFSCNLDSAKDQRCRGMLSRSVIKKAERHLIEHDFVPDCIHSMITNTMRDADSVISNGEETSLTTTMTTTMTTTRKSIHHPCFIHRSGAAFITLTDSDFIWSPNSLRTKESAMLRRKSVELFNEFVTWLNTEVPEVPVPLITAL